MVWQVFGSKKRRKGEEKKKQRGERGGDGR
jgi:hypothetical protein